MKTIYFLPAAFYFALFANPTVLVTGKFLSTITASVRVVTIFLIVILEPISVTHYP